MTPILDGNGIVEQLLYQQSGYWLAAGGATLLIYDWLLCLDREVQYVWKARWSFGKIWFIFHRYAMMALAIGMVYGSVKSESSSLEWCKMWDILSNVGTTILIVAIQGTFALRVCALYRNSPYTIAFVGAIYISCYAYMLVFFPKLYKATQYLPNTFTPYQAYVRTCDNCMLWGIYLYIPLMLLDVVILLLTLRRSFVAKSQRSAAPILDTLFRDGILYFVVAFAIGLVNIVFGFFGPGAAKTWMAGYTGPLLSSMATRLLLNLHDQVARTAHYPADSPTTVNEGHTNAFSTVEFAPPAVTEDVEIVLHDASGGRSTTDNRTRREDRNDEVNVFEMKTLERADREESTLSPGWVDSERMLAVPGRRQRGAVKVDAV